MSEKANIYKIYNTANPHVFYVGSVKNSDLNQRLSKHLSKAKIDVDDLRKLYVYMRKFKFSGFKIKSIIELKYQSSKHLKKIENGYIIKLKPQLNSIHSFHD